MRTISLALLSALLAAACTAAPDAVSLAEERLARAAAAAPAGAGFIESVEYTGTGCPEKSATLAFSPDKQVVTSIFSAFIAVGGGGSDPAAATRHCLLMMQVNVPPGWSYSLESVDHRGFAGLQSDVTASRQSLYMISGSPVHVTPPATFKGAADADFTHGDVGPTAPAVWSPCGGGQLLWIATQTGVKNGSRSRGGQIALDTIDTELQWRRCP